MMAHELPKHVVDILFVQTWCIPESIRGRPCAGEKSLIEPTQISRAGLSNSLCGGRFGGCRRHSVTRRNEFALDFGPFCRRQRALFPIRRQIMDRKVGTGFLRTRRRIGRRTDQGHIRDGRRAAANSKRRREQRSYSQCPPFTIYQHPYRNLEYAN
jgi:hypothetical protein